MAIDLISYLDTGGDSPRLWINFNAYAKKLLSDGKNPWTTPASYMSFYGQAHGLVKADVAVLDVWDLYQHWMQEDKDALKSMVTKRRVTAPVKKMLEAFAPRELLAEVITAVSNNYNGSVPIVLVIPSPRALVVKAYQAANDGDIEPDEMSVDTAAMYLADYLRYFSETDLSGVLLMEDESFMPLNSEELSWYQPVFNVTKHYRWAVGVHLPTEIENFVLPEGVNFSIVPAQSGLSDGSLGIDISEQLWKEGGSSLMARSTGFNYLSIPEASKPEFVLDTLSTIKGK
ncbi:hypothetical protein A9Q98_07020 [Thalassotalea sp. 42_200_T64]|nr:hypothetical protein A9Q98_07020 [Thalassotalea sp. 42_200_T64]